MRLLWLLVLLLLPGCTTDPEYAISGSFTQDRTDADIDELRTIAEERGGGFQLRESSPEQFTIGGLTREDCEELQAELPQKPYLQDVGLCTSERAGADPY